MTRRRVDGGPTATAQLAEFVEVVHHLLLINGAVNVAFPVPPRVRHTDPRGVAVGLGETGERLRAVLDEARRLAAAPRPRH